MRRPTELRSVSFRALYESVARATRTLPVLAACLLAAACSSSEPTDEVVAPAAASTAVPSTTTSATPATTTTTSTIAPTTTAALIPFEPTDAAPYLAVVEIVEEGGFVWPVSRAESYENAQLVCQSIAAAQDIPDLTALARDQWASQGEPTQESWELTRALYVVLSGEYCPMWSLPAGAIGETPAETAEKYRSLGIDLPNALSILLSAAHPRAGALLLTHLPATDFVLAELEALEERDSEQYVAVVEELTDLSAA